MDSSEVTFSTPFPSISSFKIFLDGYEDINQLIERGCKITEGEKERIKESFEIRKGGIVLKEQRRISSLLMLKPIRAITRGGIIK